MIDFFSRLDQIPDRLLSNSLLNSTNIGKEVAVYVFDYPPERELILREYLKSLPDRLNKKSHHQLNIISINIFEEIIHFFKDKNYYNKIVEMQKKRGNDVVQKGLSSILDDSTIINIFKNIFQDQSFDLIIMHGAGAAWPMIRMHSLLNIIQPLIKQTPLILFYPGTFDQLGLKLFNRLPSDNYYRAFQLLP